MRPDVGNGRVGKLARRVLVRITTRFFGPLRDRGWRQRFQWQRFLAGGTVQLGPSVFFRNPVVFKGQGSVIVDANVQFGWSEATASAEPIMLQPRSPEACIRIGEGTMVMNGVEMIALQSIVIGKQCRIGPRALIMDSDFHGLNPDERGTPGLVRSVAIGDNVWIGTNVTILKGVTVGSDAVLGAYCVVTKDVASGEIVVGNPMRVTGSAYGR